MVTASIYFCSLWFLACIYIKCNLCFGGQLENQWFTWPSYSNFHINSIEKFILFNNMIYKVCNLALVKIQCIEWK